jgi:hypothetical protein
MPFRRLTIGVANPLFRGDIPHCIIQLYGVKSTSYNTLQIFFFALSIWHVPIRLNNDRDERALTWAVLAMKKLGFRARSEACQ